MNARNKWLPNQTESIRFRYGCGAVQIMLPPPNSPKSIHCTWTQSCGMLNSLKSVTLRPQFPSSLINISRANPFLGCHIWSKTIKVSPPSFVAAAMSTVSTPQPSSSSAQDETTPKKSQPLQVNFMFNWNLGFYCYYFSGGFVWLKFRACRNFQVKIFSWF